MSTSLMAAFKSGDWVTKDRIHVYSWMLIAMTVALLSYLFITANGLNDYQGRPLGTDYANVYTAGEVVLDGRPTDAYNLEKHYAQQQALFGENALFFGWCYPPFFLTLATLLAMLPYLVSLVVWQASSLALYLWNLRSIFPEKLLIPVALAFPAVFVNIGHGHNGFLSAALMGGGLLLLKRNPILAGICFGLLSYKPQFGVLIPLALIAGKYWRCFFAASATVISLIILSTLLFGVEIWEAFHSSLTFTRVTVLEEGNTGFYKLQSMFAWVRLWEGSVPLAYFFQISLSLAVAISIWKSWRSNMAYEYQAALLVMGSLLVTPYLLDYDMVILAPAIAFCVKHGLEKNFAPYEKSLLALLFITPLFARVVALYLWLPIGVILMLMAYWHISRHANGHHAKA